MWDFHVQQGDAVDNPSTQMPRISPDSSFIFNFEIVESVTTDGEGEETSAETTRLVPSRCPSHASSRLRIKRFSAVC